MIYTLGQLLNRLTFRQLQVFQVVFHKLSYSKAAEELGLTQPAVSAQMKQLEAALGQPMFDYVGKQLYVTPAGAQLEKVVREIFSDLETLQMNLYQLEGKLRGELRLCVISSAEIIVPYLLKGFLEKFPQVEVRVTVLNRTNATDRLLQNQDDIVITGIVPDTRLLSRQPFYDNLLVPVVRAGHSLLEQNDVTAQAFFDAGFLQREVGSGSRAAIEGFCKSQRIQFTPVLEFGSNESVKHGVIAGLGVALLPFANVISELKTGVLVMPKIKGFPIKRSWCAVYPSSKQPTPVMQAFLDHLRDEGDKCLSEEFRYP
ncbi:LysR family transcriptional regulator [Marinomonas communis]|uniref:LysR family transcriptional regulator n=1 Tax=Marinomonas communis TaxID=28254 RepID=UPI001D19506A|nr:LysR family transcriptional regulator [Marinomonas communis]MCC4275039.1 LysR family transcriptional regulator [Marinomonas communis]MEC8081326.1 LysR family transcriptional regulator [Pseudomonadota bacterium]